jgi:uncharacterized RDD family membrane protein YckC
LNSQSNLPTSEPEVLPLIVGVIGIAIPVGLIAWACVSGSVIVLILAVLSMFVVGGGTLMFILMLTDDGPEEHHGSDAAAE